MAVPTPTVPEEPYENQLMYSLSSSNAHTNQVLEDAYQNYQSALKTTFQNTLEGKLNIASESLVDISDWLLSNVVELGM